MQVGQARGGDPRERKRVGDGDKKSMTRWRGEETAERALARGEFRCVTIKTVGEHRQ